jgi:hypothetical protein
MGVGWSGKRRFSRTAEMEMRWRSRPFLKVNIVDLLGSLMS